MEKNVSMTIWKWKIPRGTRFNLSMPGGAEVIHIGTDGNDGLLWARVNPNSQSRPREFERHLTGALSSGLSDTSKHLGSYMENDGFMAHIFEEQK